MDGMEFRYPAVLALTLALAALAMPVQAARKPPSPPAAPTANELYSLRALRRAKVILQLKLLELRAQHLERVRRAIERHLPIDEILKS